MKFSIFNLNVRPAKYKYNCKKIFTKINAYLKCQYTMHFELNFISLYTHIFWFLNSNSIYQ